MQVFGEDVVDGVEKGGLTPSTVVLINFYSEPEGRRVVVEAQGSRLPSGSMRIRLPFTQINVDASARLAVIAGAPRPQ